MIKIGVEKNLENARHLPIAVIEAIAEIVYILGVEYGTERDIETALGGYVAIIEAFQDLEQLKNAYLDVAIAIPEWVERIPIEGQETWIKALFLLSSDYAIVVVGEESILSFLMEAN